MNGFERELEDIVARCVRRPVFPFGYGMRIEQRGYGTYLVAYRRPRTLTTGGKLMYTVQLDNGQRMTLFPWEMKSA